MEKKHLSTQNKTSRRIYAITNLIECETNPEKKKQLEKDLKQLQYQGLLHIAKTNNCDEKD